MIADVAAIEHLHRELHQAVLVQATEFWLWNLLSRIEPSLPTR
jgi:hypothetical protein